MTTAAPDTRALSRTIERLMREDRGRLLAALIARLRDFQLAEEALQEAAISALSHWGRSGLPASPQGWLLRVALRKAIDRLRGSARDARKAADLARLAVDEAAETEPEMIPDERLRLIFTCCHPALEPKSRVALTLRTVAGLTTAEIARAFLDAEPTMGQRLSRAKAKIAAAGIPFVIPGPEDWPGRLQSVLAVVYLVYNAGYTAGAGPGAGDRDLCGEAVFLARLLCDLSPGDAEIEGILALLLLTQGRAGARIGADGMTVPPARQDRRLWDHAALAEGLALLDRAMARRAVGPYQVKAAIAACHGAEGGSDWPQIAALYTRLLAFEPTPVVRLNRAVALAEAGGLPEALVELADLAAVLDNYAPFHAAQAEFLTRAGQGAAARAAYDRAIAGAGNDADAAFLISRRDRRPT